MRSVDAVGRSTLLCMSMTSETSATRNTAIDHGNAGNSLRISAM